MTPEQYIKSKCTANDPSIIELKSGEDCLMRGEEDYRLKEIKGEEK
jgi:hypothetical protein